MIGLRVPATSLALVIGTERHDEDPRTAFGFYLQQRVQDVEDQTASFDDILDEVFHIMVAPFFREHFPVGASLRLGDGRELRRAWNGF